MKGYITQAEAFLRFISTNISHLLSLLYDKKIILNEACISQFHPYQLCVLSDFTWRKHF